MRVNSKSYSSAWKAIFRKVVTCGFGLEVWRYIVVS